MKYLPLAILLMALITIVLIGMALIIVKETGFIGGIIYILIFDLIIAFNFNKN